MVGEAAIPVIKLLIGEDGWITPRLIRHPAGAGGGHLVLSPLLIRRLGGAWMMAVQAPDERGTIRDDAE